MKIQNKKGYALALFNLAKEKNKVQLYFNQIQEIKNIIENKELFTVLNLKELAFNVKNNIIEDIFKNKVDKYIVNFLKIIVQKNEFYYIKNIIDHFIKICSKELKISFGIVYSTKELSKKSIEILENFYTKKINQKIKLKNLIDKSLIKGIKLEIENKIYENSINNFIRDLKKSILEKRQ